jgi:tetratricopeptide (TPR) repeat protein
MNTTRDILTRRLAEHPRSPLFARVAELFLDENRLEDALSLCDEGLTVYPYYPTAHLIRARILRKLGRYPEVETELETVRRLVPDATTIAAELNAVREMLASQAAASTATHAAGRAAAEVYDDDPSLFLASRTLAEVYAGQGQLREAIKVYEHLLATKPAGGRDILPRLDELRALLAASESEKST